MASSDRAVENNSFRDHTHIHQGDIILQIHQRSGHPGTSRLADRQCRDLSATQPRYVKNFIPRSIAGVSVVEALDAYFAKYPKSQIKSPVAVLRGMGGSGKSQVALRYNAESRISGKFNTMFWIDASSPSALARSFEAAYQKITGHGAAGSAQGSAFLSSAGPLLDTSQQAVNAVKAYAAKEGPWFFVFDNFDRPHDFQFPGTFTWIGDYWPPSSGGQVLITSRHKGCDELGEAFEIGRMNDSEAVALLRERSKSTEDDEALIGVAKSVGSLALALAQAGSYMKSRKVKTTLFQQRFLEQEKKIMESIPKGSWEYRRYIADDYETDLSVFTTWDISLAALSGTEDEKRQGVELLTMAGFLDPFDISSDIFRRGYVHSDASDGYPGANITRFLPDDEWDSSIFEEFIMELNELSIIEGFELDGDGTGLRFSLHPLVSDWIKLKQLPASRSQYALDSVEFVRRSLPRDIRQDSGGNTPRELQRLATHMATCVHNCQTFPHTSRVLGVGPLHRTGITVIDFLDFFELYSDVETVCNAALKWKANAKIPWTEDFIEIGHQLSWSLKQQGRLTEALRLAELLSDEAKSVLGPDKEITLSCRSRLGSLNLDVGIYRSAEEILVDTYKRQRIAVGPRKKLTLVTLAVLADVYRVTGRVEQSISLFRTVYTALQSVCGPDNATSMEVACGLAVAYAAAPPAMLPDDALDFAIACLSKLEGRYGETHLRTLSVLWASSTIHRNMGNAEAAEKLLKKLLEISEQLPRPTQAAVFHSCGKFYLATSPPNLELELLYQTKAAAIFKELGQLYTSDGVAATVLGALALNKAGRTLEAEAMLQDLLQACEASTQPRYDLEAKTRWGAYFLVMGIAMSHDESRKSQAAMYLDKAVQVSMRAYASHEEVAARLENALSGYQYFGNENMVDWASGLLLMVRTAQSRDHGGATVSAPPTSEEISVPLPSPIATICDALYECHYYPDWRYMALVWIALAYGDVANAQIGLEQMLGRQEWRNNDPQPLTEFFPCSQCKQRVGNKFYACSEGFNCHNFALDEECYELLHQDATASSGAGACGHKFLRVPRDGWENWDNEKVDESKMITEWLLEMKEKYGNAELPSTPLVIDAIYTLDLRT